MHDRRRNQIGSLSSRQGLIGYLVWQIGKWYLKQRLRSKRAELVDRLPSARKSLLIGISAASALVATAVVVRRLSG